MKKGFWKRKKNCLKPENELTVIEDKSSLNLDDAKKELNELKAELDVMINKEESKKKQIYRGQEYDQNKKEWKYIEDTLIIFDDELKLHFYYAPRLIPGQENRASTANTQTATFSNRNKTDDEENDEDQQEEKEEIDPIIFRKTVLGPSYGTIKKFRKNT